MDMMTKKIRTKAWLHYIATQTGVDATSPSALEGKTGQPRQYWHRYQKGNPPSETIRELVEKKIPGSKRIYDVGPDSAPLWTALWSDDQAELWSVAKSISKRVSLNAALSGGPLICDYTQLEHISTYFKSLVEYASKFSRWDKVDAHHLAALVAAFRLTHYKREIVSYQINIVLCIKKCNIDTICWDYGISDYISGYISNLILSKKEASQNIQLIKSEHIIFDLLGLSRNFPKLRPMTWDDRINKNYTLEDIPDDFDLIDIPEEPLSEEDIDYVVDQFFEYLGTNKFFRIHKIKDPDNDILQLLKRNKGMLKQLADRYFKWQEDGLYDYLGISNQRTNSCRIPTIVDR